MTGPGRLLVLFGSQTFTAQEIAERIWRKMKILGFRGPVQAMDEYPISRLIHEEYALFVCSTTGKGDEPDNMKKFWKFLLRKNLPLNSLVRLKFGVLGLGDSSYPKFNFVGKKLHKRLIQLGATPLLDIGLCDFQHDIGHDAVLIPWMDNFYTKLKQYIPNIETRELKTKFVPRWKVSLLKENPANVNNLDLSEDIYFSTGIKELCIESVMFEVEKNLRTTDESHFQDVRLLSFKPANCTTLNFKPGDIFNIRPRNSKEDIEDLFEIFETHNIDIKPHYRLFVEENYEDMPVPGFLKQPLTIYEIAEQYWDLRVYPTQYVFSLLALVSEDKLERDKCIELSSPEGQEEWLNYCRRPRRTIIEVLQDFHKSASKLTIEILFELFSCIKPRSFSIANSSLASQGKSLELLIAVVKYYSKLKKPRLGLASNWLKQLKVCDKVYGWIKKGSIDFPKDLTIPLILIGPGTGFAPFRSLLQERDCQSGLNKSTIHVFFGCRYKEKDYHCRDELEKWERDGKISLYCAFSRDQENKVYVQHKIEENREILWSLICKQEAYIFISGNAKNMPDNVKNALVDVFVKTGNCSEVDSRTYLNQMEESGRLQVETW